MAYTLRTAILRQVRQHVASGRGFKKQAFTMFAAPSKVPIIKTQPIPTTSPPFNLEVQQNTSLRLQRVAAFHTSGCRTILPAGPQVIDGTANEAAPIMEPSPTHGSYHWAFERLISVVLIPLTVAPFAAGSLNPITDAILCAAIIIHTHIGFQSVIIDYIPSKRLPRTRALFWWGLRAATLSVAAGFYEFETNDVGLTEAIKRIWTA